jgi:hypothetical protein
MPINENAPLVVVPGAIRFNTDSMKLEYYRGGPVGFGTTTTTGEWVNLTTDSPDIQTGGARGVIAGGYVAPGYVNTLDYITISTTGNATSFGTLTTQRGWSAGMSSSTRGVFAAGQTAPGGVYTNTIEYITISSTGSVTSFGSLSSGARHAPAGCSSSTRGLIGGGYVAPAITNTIDYITIASTGNTVSFGTLTQARQYISAGVNSSTRGIWGPSETATINTIEFVTISTLGNAVDFGDSTVSNRAYVAGCSNSIRGLFGGGYTPSPTAGSNVVDYITIATLGNAIDFGDLTRTICQFIASCASSTRGTWSGGTYPAATNIIDYVTIMSTGNAVDFGDLTQARYGLTGLSNGHGGLG